MTKKPSPPSTSPEPSPPDDAVAGWEAWLATRPPHIAHAARQFPPGVTLKHEGQLLWLIGYHETSTNEVMLIFSKIDPSEDYDAAHQDEQRVLVCASHLNPKYLE